MIDWRQAAAARHKATVPVAKTAEIVDKSTLEDIPRGFGGFDNIGTREVVKADALPADFLRR